MIQIDTREPVSMAMVVSAELGGDTNVITLRDGADYLIFDAAGHSAAFQRKARTDLLNSLSKRMKNGEVELFDQIRRMAETYDHRFLVVEDMPTYDPATHKFTRSGWSHGAVQLMLLQIELDGTPIIYTDGKRATADLLRIFNQRAARGCVLPTHKEAA